MAEKNEGRKDVGPLIAGGGAGFLLGILSGLGLSRPVEAAPPEERMDYLISLLEHLVAADVTIIDWLSKINTSLGALGVPGVPGIEVTVLTPWVGKEPQLIFQQAIRAAGNSQSDDLVDYRNAKRVVFKVESSLNQAVIVQLVGNITKSFNLATNVNGAFPCPANGNISIGLAWDDWQPYIGVIITAAPPPATPTAGILTIWAVEQE